MEPSAARRMWQVLEPYHALVYFSPQTRQAMEDAGLRGFWRGYFAGRAAPLGRTPAPVVTATFFGFHPSMVERAIPAVWDLVEPADAAAARQRGADATLREVLDGDVDSSDVAEAADLARRAAGACDPVGRALFAAHLDLPWPTEPHLVLWHAATLLREHRGDTHNAALVAAGIDGCQAQVLAAAAGRSPRRILQASRSWSDAEWDDAADRLAARGILTRPGGHAADAPDELTDAGRALVDDVEARTDAGSLAPWEHLGTDATEHLRALVAPLARRVLAADWFPSTTPIGLPD
jgi:hypothetical protein